MSGSTLSGGNSGYPVVTVTVNGQVVTFTSSTAEQYLAAQSFAQALNLSPQSSPGTVIAGIDNGSPSAVQLVPQSRDVVVFGNKPHTVTGATLNNSTSDPVNVFLDNTVAPGSTGSTYNTGGTVNTIVTAYDNTDSTISNTSGGNLVAFTGKGPNALNGATGNNNFTTATGGSDAVVLNGTSNVLNSGGQDAVMVGGPSTITATPGGSDNVVLTSGTTLHFENQSNLTSTITGTAGSSIFVNDITTNGFLNTGNTSVTSGGGAENFTVDTTAGNVTLTGSTSGVDNFTFQEAVAGQTGHSGREVINNFASNDTLTFANYGANPFTQTTTGSGNSTVTTFSLRDGSTITVNGAPVNSNQIQTR